MPRTISQDLRDHLARAVLTLAYCVRVERIADGRVFGFTSHDEDLLIEGEIYEAVAAVQASSVTESAGTGVDNLEIVGLLQSDRITDIDIRAGLYDGARVQMFIVNYEDLAAGKLRLPSGIIGKISFQSGTYTAEVRSLFQRLQQQIVELTSPLCRVKRLFDARCNGDGNVDTSQFIVTDTVQSVQSAMVVTVGPDAHASGFYDYGEIRTGDGFNADIAREIKAHLLVSGNAQLTLQDPFPFLFAPGDSVVLTAGCDRRSETCRDKFGNLVNFRAEPHIPGTDKVLRRGRR